MSAPLDDPWADRELTFRPARPEDLRQIVDILSEAAAWAKARGVERWWSVPFPEAWVRSGIERGDVVVAESRSRIVGTLMLTRQDLLMWGEQPPVAGYIHRVAIRREFAHQGLGRRILEWAATEVRSWGRVKLRLDCLATNESLVTYYRNQGFREVGRIQGNIPGEDRPSILMERSLS
jgi:ribosomal protein S18 acetylase RimI-like enzyme